ncbi:hypothetical protein CPB84DRAFT_1770622, partial [Gymnopilus junonius]
MSNANTNTVIFSGKSQLRRGKWVTGQRSEVPLSQNMTYAGLFRDFPNQFPTSTKSRAKLPGRGGTRGAANLSDGLNTQIIHRLENVFILECSLHQAFDGLDLRFEETDTPNAYKIRASHPYWLRGLVDPVVFK